MGISRRSFVVGGAVMPLPFTAQARAMLGSGAQAYLGQIATRTYVPNNYFAPHTAAVSDSVHFIRDTVFGAQLVLANWYWLSGEISPAATTYRASVEYPSGSGNWFKCTIAGADSGVCAGGINLIVDPIPQWWVAGTAVKVRVEQKSASGILYRGAYVPSNTQSVLGEGFRSVTSGLADYMTGGAYTTTDTLVEFGPVAIIGRTKRPSLFLAGDSRMFGQYDTCDASGDWGEVARSLGPSFAYINAGTPGEKASSYIAANAKRTALAAYCSHVICEYGGADLNQTSDTAAAIFGYIQTIAALFPGKQFWQTTSTPQTTSTNGWIDLANQNIISSLESRRLAFNGSVRGMPRFFDTTAGIESGGTGKWQVSPTNTAYTADGVHANQAGYLAIKASGVISPTAIHR